jgi:hypothetical protein
VPAATTETITDGDIRSCVANRTVDWSTNDPDRRRARAKAVLIFGQVSATLRRCGVVSRDLLDRPALPCRGTLSAVRPHLRGMSRCGLVVSLTYASNCSLMSDLGGPGLCIRVQFRNFIFDVASRTFERKCRVLLRRDPGQLHRAFAFWASGSDIRTPLRDDAFEGHGTNSLSALLTGAVFKHREKDRVMTAPQLPAQKGDLAPNCRALAITS